MKITRSNIVKVLLMVLVSSLIVMPLAYAINDFYGILMTFPVMILLSFGLLEEQNYFIATWFSVTVGFWISVIVWAVTSLRFLLSPEVETHFLWGFMPGFLLTVLPLMLFGKHISRETRYHLRIEILVSTFILILISVVALLLVEHFHATIWENVIAAILGVSSSACLGVLLGYQLKFFVLPSLALFEVIMDYIRAMVLPVGVFFVGYFIILFSFAGFYGVLYHLEPSSFQATVGNGIFAGQFIYFSIMMITGTGDTQIQPVTALAKLLVTGELIFGVIWTTVVLAAAIGYLQGTFNELAAKHKESSQFKS